MTMRISNSVADAFLKNRAEQLPDDVWGEFIVPRFFANVTALRDTKAIKIEGGRGCGKTIFMRNLCHAAQFSTNRPSIADSALAYIGLYWKPDIRFARLLT